VRRTSLARRVDVDVTARDGVVAVARVIVGDDIVVVVVVVVARECKVNRHFDARITS